MNLTSTQTVLAVSMPHRRRCAANTSERLAHWRRGNLDREVNAENLARFLGLTSSAYRESCSGDCTVRVQLNTSTGHCLGFAVVSVPESRAKELLAHNGRFKADRKFCGGQPIVIYPVEDEGSTSNHKMDSSSRNVKSQSSDKSPGCKTGSSSVHVKISTGTIRSASAQGNGTGFSTWVNNEPMSPRRPYRLIDIGANLTHRKYATDLPQVIQRSKAAGVQKVIVTGLNVRGSEEALQLCREYPSYLWCTVGVHPHDAKSWRSSTFDRLEYLSRQPGCVAIGECGLDFNRNYSPRDVQLEVFEKQVQLACKVRKPLLLHDRESHECFVKILNKYQAELPPVVCHCFTGRRTEALRYIAMGFYIGLTGYLWKDNSNDGVRSLLYDDEIPLDKILLETDAPFMYPFLGRGRFPQSTMDCVSPGSLQLLGCCSYQRNEPCAMPVINELVAGCMKRSPSELADITTENALRFFNLSVGSYKTWDNI
ncbi:3'-5' ssDNA/RNA exonuclease TatD [Lamellibrachia satsuma]|nr:3'-5' ssDNA/RNA exonuclease TatD [Lamellibrachia satsuma]